MVEVKKNIVHKNISTEADNEKKNLQIYRQRQYIGL